MDARTHLIAASERQFHEHGFMATGMDTLARAAGMSSRTLYKHAGSKTELIVAVLDERDRRFFEQIDRLEVSALFAALARWIESEGARGCLFLRAIGETGGAQPDIAAAVLRHKKKLRQRVMDMVRAETGRDDAVLADRIVLLFEGAVAASAYQGQDAVRMALDIAGQMIGQARRKEGGS